MALRPVAAAYVRRLRPLVAAAVLGCAPAACAALPWPGGGEAFLRAGAIEPLTGARPLDAPAARAAWAPPSAGVPLELSAAGGLRPLPGAAVPGVGPVEALVVSVSLGPQRPHFGELELRDRVFGAAARGPADRSTVAAVLERASNGAFRLHSDVLPTLVDTRASELSDAPAPAELERLARRALAAWARDTTLGRWDNDGPDGLPSSGDDDGRLDLVVVAVESEERFAPFVARRPFVLRSRGARLRVDAVHLLSLPRTEAPASTAALELLMEALGLGPEERRSPEAAADASGGAPGASGAEPAVVGLLARARLGWLPLRELGGGGVPRALRQGEALLVPLENVAPGAGFWLVEHAGGALLAARVVRRAEAGYAATETLRWGGPGELRLALDRRLGERGPVIRLSWHGDGPAAERLAAGAGSAAASDTAPPGPERTDGGADRGV